MHLHLNLRHYDRIRYLRHILANFEIKELKCLFFGVLPIHSAVKIPLFSKLWNSILEPDTSNQMGRPQS